MRTGSFCSDGQQVAGTVSKIYRHARRRNLTEANPEAHVPLRKIGNVSERFLSAAEETRLRKVLQDDIDSHEAHPELRKEAVERLVEFKVSILTGMRKGEQYNLRWSDVDFERGIMRLRLTKNGRPRKAYMIEEVARFCKLPQDLKLNYRSAKRDEDLVFSKSEQEVVAGDAEEGEGQELSLA